MRGAAGMQTMWQATRGNGSRARWRALMAALGALAIAKAGVLAVAWAGSQRSIHPKPVREAQDLPEYDFAAHTEDVRFASLDGTPLAAWFVPHEMARAATVILLHGYGNSRAQLLPHAAYLHRAGYHVLLIDFRGRGASSGAVTVGVHEPLDVRAAVSYVLSRPEVDPDRIALQGVSLGASAGILAMADDPRVAAIVAESAFTALAGAIRRSFAYFISLPTFPFAPLTVFVTELRVRARATRVRPLHAIPHVQRPIFIIDDLADARIPLDSGRLLYDAAPGPKELWLVADAVHAGGYTAAPDEYERRVLDFYARYL